MPNIINAAVAAAFLSTTSLSVAVASDSNDATPVSSLSTVTVMATKSPTNSFDIPGMVTVINADDPSNGAVSNIKNLLNDVPGVEFGGSARRNGQTIFMRGYGTDGLTVLFDGVRQKSEAAHDGKFFIDPNLLKSVEVVRGPNSALYGSGGLGGVVAFETKDAADLLEPGQNLGAMTSFGAQSVNDEWMTSQSVYGRSDAFDILVSALTRNSDDITLGDGSKLDSQDRVLSGLVKVGWSIDDYNSLKFNMARYHNDAREPNNPQDNNNDSLSNKDVASQRTSLAYEYADPSNDLVNVKASIYHNNISVDETQIGTSRDLSRQIETVGFTLENKTRIRLGEDVKNTLVYGVESYREEQNGSDTSASNGESGAIPDAQTDYQALFVQNEIAVDSLGVIPGKLLVIPGVRFDRYQSKNTAGTSIDAKEASPKFGVTYKPKDWLMLFGNYAQGFRAPTMTEIFTTGTHFSIPGLGNNIFVPNLDLRPETNESREFGFGMQFDDVVTAQDHMQFKFSRFNIDSEDYIDAEVDFIMFPSCCGTSRSVNVDKARLWGHEFEGGYENKRIRLNVGYSYITGKDVATNAYLTNIAPQTFTTNFALKLPEYGSVVGWKSTFADRHDKVNDAENARDGYSVHDVYYQVQPAKLGNVTINIGIDNVFDKNYERVFAGSPEPGRNYKMQVNYKW